MSHSMYMPVKKKRAQDVIDLLDEVSNPQSLVNRFGTLLPKQINICWMRFGSLNLW